MSELKELVVKAESVRNPKHGFFHSAEDARRSELEELAFESAKHKFVFHYSEENKFQYFYRHDEGEYTLDILKEERDWRVNKTIHVSCSCDDYIDHRANSCVHCEALKRGLRNTSVARTSPIIHYDSFSQGLTGFNLTPEIIEECGLKRSEDYTLDLLLLVEDEIVFRAQMIAHPEWFSSSIYNFYSRKELPSKDIQIDFSFSKKEPFPFQKEGIKFLVEKGRACLADDMGLGKAQPITTPVLTPTGWRPIGTLGIGDLVIGSDGNPVKVTGVYPQGQKTVYKIVLDDGSSTFSCREHLWTVQTPNDRFRGGKTRTLQLSEIIEAGIRDKSGNSKWFIPSVKSINFSSKHRSFYIHPYLMGALLANGHFGNTIDHTGNDEQREQIKKYLPEDITFKLHDKITWSFTTKISGFNRFTRELKYYGLGHVNSPKKFIPKDYLFSSIENRIAILQGLMDNDGTISKDGKIVEYNTTSEQLARDVIHLIRSLGGIAWYSTRIPKFTYKDEVKNGLMDYRVRMALPDGLLPFTIPAKAGRYHGRTKYVPTHSIKEIIEHSEAECVCISVDTDDHLYVTENFILTHNTIQAILASENMTRSGLISRVLIICPASLKGQWQREIEEVAGSEAVCFHNAKDYVNFYLKNKRFPLYSIFSYEFLKRNIDLALIEKWGLIILDEAQKIKNPETKAYKTISTIPTDYLFMLTGTPVENRLSDIYHLMKIVDPNYLGPKWLFDYRYNVLSDTGYLEGHKNVQELQKKLKGIVLRREKKSVMQDLPDLLETSRYVDILPQQKQVEAKNVEIAVNIMTQGRNRELSWNEKQIVQQCLVKARLACNAPELVNVQANSSPKLDELEELLEEIEPSPDKKIIIFSEWVRMLDLVKPRLEKRGLKYISFTGSVDSRYRQSYIDQFNNDPDKVIFLSSEAGGVGLNLQAASYVVNLDIPWNPGRLRQRINRIHRIGQKSNCTVINIVAKNCIEEGIELVLKSKMKVAEASLQEGSDSDFIELSSFLDYLDKYKENT